MSERLRASVHLSQRTEQRDCAYCREALDEEPWLCPLCHCALHRDCGAELSSCPSLGCSAPVSFADPRPAEELDAPWRIAALSADGVSLVHSAEECRLSFDPHPEVEPRRRKAPNPLVWLAVLVVALMWIENAGLAAFAALIALLFIGLAALGRGGEEPGRRRWRRMRSLVIVVRPGSWEIIESFLDSDAPSIRRLTKPLPFDASKAEAGLLRLGDEELSLPPRPGEEQRRLARELERAWRGTTGSKDAAVFGGEDAPAPSLS